MTGDAELANHEDVEWRVQRLRDLETYRHATARQRQDQYARAIRVGREPCCQYPSGLMAVTESHWRLSTQCVRRCKCRMVRSLERLQDHANPAGG